MASSTSGTTKQAEPRPVAGSPVGSSESSVPEKRKRPSKARKNKPVNAAVTESTNLNPGPSRKSNKPKKSPSPAGPKPQKATGNSKNKHVHKPRDVDVTKDYKYLQIKKLIRKFKPVTINGLPMKNIAQSADEPDEAKALDAYLQRFIKNQSDQAIYLSFIVIPSDPDFPFDLDSLKVSLCIPAEYPHRQVIPSIYVLNDEIPRGFAANIELGFKRITSLAAGKPLPSPEGELEEQIQLVDGKGLLSQVLTLDRFLEVFLKQEKRKTIKFVKGKPSKGSKSTSVSGSPSPSPAPTPVQQVHAVPVDENKRNQLLKQLHQKLKADIKLFNRSKLYTKYKIFVPVYMAEDLPQTWVDRGKIEILITVPLEYPSRSVTLEVPGQFSNATGNYVQYETNLIRNFDEFQAHGAAGASENLVARINYLANHLNVFCMDPAAYRSYTELTSQFGSALSV
ncbi:hypothetical protein PSN45_000898 [Yamadazyma tenuis]|uniref:Uncharacterized protein n=1 Tax=Candida tenuis (strain ATCC 10573 / BCRC 21748 / CBS 615 / JCM 9827 / NBRC 10315 / NRRL Y-1498 / VKM Y-70) TaxID=590646 RepID=G3BBF5_CANTC|nr:uncharacterized protein CANTEDRAFT_136115 [Yamadazyma tenuis ATCC 10573]EGV62179.1 hypothetical protein CANTEDRAFT_136115 [Yamadazyma tenuis ATCC 10573]WEJ93435.1 hypothetical protein PSN45_000898 [Yamadazyma tenuis]